MARSFTITQDGESRAFTIATGVGASGTNGSDASVTEANVLAALGYTPADNADLGGAALLDVGTTAGTVAAGDDARLVSVTNASDGGDGATDSGKLAKFTSLGGIIMGNSSTNGTIFRPQCGSGIATYSVAESGTGGSFISNTGTAAKATSQSGTYHAEFGTSGDNRSFVERLLGAFGWWRGANKLTVSAVDTLTADRVQRFQDADGTIALTSDITPEGTAIKSTGETGGTKFLREDGDGTCSWQAAGGSVSTIVGITGTLAEFNTACTDADFAPIASPAFTGAVTLSGQSLTGSEATSLVNLGTTWGTTGNPTMIYGRVTNTASGSTAKLIDLGTAAGGSFFSVSKTGELLAYSALKVGVSATTIGSIGGTNLPFNNSLETYSSFGFHQGIAFNNGISTSNVGMLYGESTNTIAQRKSANSQIFRLYNTFTARGAGTTNLEALETRAQAAGSFIIQSLKGSAGGTARDIEFRHGATDTNNVITAGTLIATVTATGFVADGGLKLGAKTVGTLPTASSNTYLEFIVTDALAPAVGAIVAAGGSAKAKVISNDTDWIVTSTL